MKIYSFVIDKRKEGFGQRRLQKMVKDELGENVSENTIASWIFYDRQPFGNEKTQFKALPAPTKHTLYADYIDKKQSAQKLAKKYNVSTVTLLKWLKECGIKLRTHIESMNTESIKNELRKIKLKRPTKDFSRLSLEKAYILGVLCGDGHINSKFIRFEIRTDKEFIEKFSEFLTKVYGLNHDYKYYKKRNSFVLYSHSELICKDLLNYGLFGTYEWRIPKKIIKSKDNKVVSNFLKGIYDSEGSINKSSINLSSVNREGLEDVRLLLKRIGIISEIYFYEKWNYYLLSIFRKEQFKHFKDNIGFTIVRKDRKLREVLKDARTYKKSK